jgi:hypothetical protein
VSKINERSGGAVSVSAGNIINPANAVETTTVTNGGTFLRRCYSNLAIASK